MSATSIVMMEHEVNIEDIDSEHIRCPQCKSDTFVMRGFSRVPRTEVWERGQRADLTMDPDIHEFDVRFIDCLRCNNRSAILPAELFLLRHQVFHLRQRVMELGGTDPLGLGKPS